MTTVSAVIVNWNRKKDTLDCLQSLTKCKLADVKLKIIVVDNGSSDDSALEIKKYLKKISFKSTNISGEVLRSKVNLGFAAGNNLGIDKALGKSDFLLLLNNDTIVDANLIDELVQAAVGYPDVGVFSPKIYFAPGFEFHKKRYTRGDIGKVIWAAGGVMDWNNVFGINRGVDKVDHGQYDKADYINFATGACLFIRSELVKKYGNFDERYFMYFEDADLVQRYIHHGWKVLYVPHAILWHKVAQSTTIGSDLNDYFITRNRLLFGMGYANWKTRFALYRESLKFLLGGRPMQKKGVLDFYLANFGVGSWRFSNEKS